MIKPLAAALTAVVLLTVVSGEVLAQWTLMMDEYPSARSSHATVSLGGDEVLMFGGDDGERDDQTWIYDADDARWKQLAPAFAPSA